MTSSMFDRLRNVTPDAFAVDDAPRWTPEPGDVLLGILRRIDTRPGRDGRPYRIAFLECEDGSLVSVSVTSTLAEDFDRARTGDGVRLEFRGTRRGKSGHTYKDYGCLVLSGDDVSAGPISSPAGDPWDDTTDEGFAF